MRNRASHYVVVALSMGLVLLTGCITINLGPGQGALQEDTIAGEGKDKIVLLDLSGVISSQEKDGLFNQPSILSDIKEQLSLAAKDRRVKGLVLRINSPGGTVTASDILYHEIKTFREQKGVPVVAQIMDVGASGGYYVASAADAIYAHPSTVTGSIGVIMLTVNARGLLEKVGVETEAVISGPRKDMGSPFRAMNPEERAIFQSVIDDFYGRFLRVVSEGRPKLSPEEIRPLADGRIYSGDQAKAKGLIDEIGYLEDAFAAVKKRANLDKAKIVTYRRPGEYRNNIYSKMLTGTTAMPGWSSLDLLSLVRGGSPEFMYLWMP